MKKLMLVILITISSMVIFNTANADRVQDALKINDLTKDKQTLTIKIKEEQDAKNWEGTQKNISLFFNGVLALAWLLK